MSEVDLITSIQKEDEEEEGGFVSTVINTLNYIGTFMLTIGFLQLNASNEIVRMNGLFVLFFGVCGTLIGWYGPEVLAVYFAKDKKFIKMFVYYGRRRKERNLVILDDVLVIKKKDDEYDIPILDETDFETAIRKVGVNFLSDKKVDRKIEQALKERYEKTKLKVETDRKRTRMDRFRHQLMKRIQGDKGEE